MVAIRIQRFVAQATYYDVPAPFEHSHLRRLARAGPPHTTASASLTDRDAGAIKPKCLPTGLFACRRTSPQVHPTHLSLCLPRTPSPDFIKYEDRIAALEKELVNLRDAFTAQTAASKKEIEDKEKRQGLCKCYKLCNRTELLSREGEAWRLYDKIAPAVKKSIISYCIKHDPTTANIPWVGSPVEILVDSPQDVKYSGL